MTRETIIKPIGNGQITIPLLRREYLHIDKKHVRARLQGNQIIIESLDAEPIDRDLKEISLNKLNTKTKKAIKDAHKNYTSGKKDAFISHDQIWNGV